jgi:adenosylcobinamide-phosphate synthase
VERRIHADSRGRGLLALLLLIAPVTLLAIPLVSQPWGVVLEVTLLYLAIGWRSLDEHAVRVRNALYADDLSLARQSVGHMVSRDTEALEREGITAATVESVLENGNDAVFGAIFWFVVAGAPGVVLYRLVNTLDAMWGYRNERYLHFGWAAARLDDVLNFVPARLTALSYALVGNASRALRCWRRQGELWESPNAGSVMAAGAGSMGVLLGGPAPYHGTLRTRPQLGEGRIPRADDIDHALRLIHRTLALWILLLFTGGWFVDAVINA